MKALFEPESIAVVGASNDERKIGHIVFSNLVRSNFKGTVYPINPKASDILGCKAYPSLTAIPGKVELVVICVPNTLVPSVMEESGIKGAEAVIVITAGFKELGKEGGLLERKVGEIAKKYGMRVLGPNCMGIMNTHHLMNITFTNIHPMAGSIAIASQSGAVCSSMLDWSTKSKVGFSKFISVGNKLDIDEADLLKSLKDDPDTNVIGMYIEGANRGKELMNEAFRTSQVKPIIVLKSGRTSSGSKAASSHTGALSGSDKIYDAAFHQANIIRVNTIDELFDLLQVFANMPMPKGDGLAIVTNAGGHGVMAADACSDYGLRLASFEKSTIEKLKGYLPEAANLYNPVDVLGDATADRYEFAIRTVMEDPNVNCVAVLLAPLDTVDIKAVAEHVASFAGKVSMPVVGAFVGGTKTNVGIELMHEANVPCYDSPDKAIRALGAMVHYKRMREASGDTAPVVVEGDRQKVQDVIASVRRSGRTSLSESEGKEILRAYGVAIPTEITASTAEAAAQAAAKIGFPVVMKIDSPDIAHKSDVGGVMVGVGSESAVRQSFELMMSKVRSRVPGATINGITICQMVKGKEVLMGMTRDEQFGPVITFGLGGVFVEIMKDVSQRIAPLTKHDVDTMVRSIRSYPILTGARGGRTADIESLKDTIFRISQIALDFPEISELEVNPVMVGDEGKGTYAVDALVVLRREN
ncbi:MAG: CoA-binding protein [Methanomassiliicoccus sp.]|nr:CoA-binding protein [Methanomassiliicoccus sp.]